MTDSESIRLQKILSDCGIASRRKAEELICQGRVSVNGKPAALGQKAHPGRDIISVDGNAIKPGQKIYIMLNKPRGYLTTLRDDRGRKTVMELLGGVSERVYPIGRLDYDSEGLLLFTNDGDFANDVAHPSNGKTKTYMVEVDGNASNVVKLLRRPVMVDGRAARAVEVKLISQNEGFIKITIEEGRNRIIRKMCLACGANVLSLKRVSIGAVTLGTLETGKWRHLIDEEVQALRFNS